MLKPITVSEVQRPTEDNPENNVQVFELDVGAIHFGDLYLTSKTYTLAWDGELDFKYLDETAHFFLNKQLDDIKSPFDFRFEKYITRVSLIISDKLLKFNFDYSEDPEGYRELLEEPDKISFARYDFQLKSMPFNYSFTAENPQSSPLKDRELAVMLPRSQPLSKSLLMWIGKKHIASRQLKLHLDYHYTAPLLAKLIKKGVV